MDRRLHDAIGLCQKAGRCRTGAYAAEKAVHEGAACLLLIDKSASAATRGRYERLCAGCGVALLPVDGLGAAAGRPGAHRRRGDGRGFCRHDTARGTAARAAGRTGAHTKRSGA